MKTFIMVALAAILQFQGTQSWAGSNGGLSGPHLTPASVDEARLADDAVTTAKIADGAVTADKIDASGGLNISSATIIKQPGDNYTLKVSSENGTVMVFWDDEGKYGFGTETPGANLPNSWTANTDTRIIEVVSVSQDVGIFIRSEAGRGLDLWANRSAGDVYIDNRTDGVGSDIIFRTRTSGTPVEIARFTGVGNVGIGVTDPSARLEILNSASIGIEGFVVQISSNDGTALFTIDGAGDVNVAGGQLLISNRNIVSGVMLVLDRAGPPLMLFKNAGVDRGKIAQGSTILTGGSATGLGIQSNDLLTFAASGSVAQMTLNTSGNLGIGLTDPGSKLEVINSDSVGTEAFVVEVSSNDGTAMWGIDGAGHHVTTGADPVLTSCGGGTPAVVGTDKAGNVTIGTGVTTSCTVTFAQAFESTPSCTVTGDNTAVTYARTITASVLTILSSADMDSDVISYQCEGL